MKLCCLRCWWMILVVGCLGWSPAGEAHAQTKQKPVSRRNIAYTDPAHTDDDFPFQGEYLGTFVEDGKGRQVGLQVAAWGDGQFLGVEYEGGLPGTGWNRRDRVVMQGRREQGYIYFAGARHQFYVSPHKAHIYTPDGQQVGTLPKVQRISPTMGLRPPAGADVLFNGKETGLLKNPRITPDGLLMEGTETVKAYGDFTLHVEFRLPYMPYARGQARANSGVYLQSRYEVQILDSFALEGKANECGALYRQRPPDLNLCLPPLSWQTYDIIFRSARFDAQGRKIQNARITVRHNGVLIHHNVELKNKTGAGRPEGPQPLPTKLQNHHNPVRFRNFWLLENGPAENRAEKTAQKSKTTGQNNPASGNVAAVKDNR